MTYPPHYRIWGLFIFIVFSWGIAWPINKVGLAFMSPLWYTVSRLMIGTFIMMILVISLKKFSWPERRDIPLILIIGILQISLYLWLANTGLSYLPAGRSALLAYTTPLWVMPINALFLQEEATPLRWIGFFLGISGLIILLAPWKIDWHDGQILFGSCLLLLASLGWAISMLCVRHMTWTKSPLELIPWQLLIGTIPVLLVALIKEPHPIITWNSALLLSLLYNGVLVTGLSYWSGVVINRELPTLVVSLGFLAVPVFSICVSSLFMHEVIDGTTLAAMIFIMLGLICVVL